MRALALFAIAFAAACGGAVPDRSGAVAVLGVDRLSGEVAPQDVELPGTEVAAARGPAAMMVMGATIDGSRVVGGASPECSLRRKANGALAPRTASCAQLLSEYAAMEKARQFLLAAGAEELLPAPVLADSSNPGLHYVAAADAFTLGEGPAGARVPAAINGGAVAREMARRQLKAVTAEVAEGAALFLGAAAAGDPGYLAASEPGNDPTGSLDLARPLPADAGDSAVLAGALWAWADASGDLLGASRAALAAARAVGSGSADPAAILSLVAAQLEGAERDQACAVFRARLHGSGIQACP
jgi:hypothetical protein